MDNRSISAGLARGSRFEAIRFPSCTAETMHPRMGRRGRKETVTSAFPLTVWGMTWPQPSPETSMGHPRSEPEQNSSTESASASASSETKSTRSWTCRTLPAEKIPGMLV